MIARDAVFGSIPSPSSGEISLGPVTLHAYGVMIALGVVAAIWLAGRRLEASGAGTREQMGSISLWSVFAGVLGARVYYVVTDAGEVWREPSRWIRIWEGGLGVPGGLAAGIIAGAVLARRRGVAASAVLTAAAPAIPLAQAIGRWGNWFNQELFGRPTDLPWALRIDDAHLPRGVASGTTFHPTFLYESLWNLALMGALLWVDRRWRLRPGRLMAVYVMGYAIGRFFVESLRIDPANSGGGLRLNQWVALAAFAGAAAVLLVDARRPEGVGAHGTGDDSGEVDRSPVDIADPLVEGAADTEPAPPPAVPSDG